MNTLSEKTLLKNNIELIEADEIFSQVQNWNKYYISNCGRLIHKNNKSKLYIVNPSITTGGYLTYTLSKPARTYNGVKVRDDKGNTKQIRTCKPAHVLVAIMYVDNRYEYTIDDLEVHHKDKNRMNNYYRNLMILSKADHGFLHTIKKISLYNDDTATYHTYKDIELLAKRLDTDVLEVLDSIRYNDKLFKSQDGKWNVYQVNDNFIGVSFNKDKV